MNIASDQDLSGKSKLFFSPHHSISLMVLCVIVLSFANSFADITFRDTQALGTATSSTLSCLWLLRKPLACIPIADQQWIQLSFVTARCDVILMVGTLAAAYEAIELSFGSLQVGPANDASLAKPSNIIQVSMTYALAQYQTMADETAAKLRLTQYLE
jgi:hypothetical protein